MNFDLILRNIARHVSLTESEQNYFVQHLRPFTVRKKTQLLKAGDSCVDTAFVTRGCLKAFSVDKDGEEHILSFAVPDWWIADLYAIISGAPAILTIEAVQDTDVLLLSRTDQEKICNEIPRFDKFFRILVEKNLVASQQRLINNMSMTAEERYIQFLGKYPMLTELVPLHNIASYLGITPEFLSKIRARMAKGSR